MAYNIGICGASSTGKSTCLNALASNWLSKSSTLKTLIISNINNNENSYYIHMPLFTNDVVIYDFPGMEQLFTDEINNLDMLIFVSNSKNALIHKSEKDIFNMIVKKLENNHLNYRYTKLTIVFNKYNIDEFNQEIIEDAKKYMSDILKNTRIKYEFYSLSFINIMVTNILDNKLICYEDTLVALYDKTFSRDSEKEFIKNITNIENHVYYISKKN